jgi:YHS domain-containing protein
MKTMLMLAAVVLSASAASPVDPVNKDRSAVAIKGYDPVAYFKQSAPVKGSAEFTHQWNGATWRFSSKGNRDEFASKPDMYAPQFGGYCSWAVSQGYTADIDPNAWKVVNGKLYLNYNKSVQKKWEADQNALIEKANRNWPGLHR